MKGAIFDLDGTLLDSMPVWDTAGEKFLRARGITPPKGLREALAFLNMPQTARYLKEQLGIPGTEDEIMRQVDAVVEEQYRLHIPLKPNADAFLRKLHSTGVKLCVATATNRSVALPALERLGIAPFFSFVLTCTDVGAGKDEPLIFEQALERLGTTKVDTLVFEDSIHAIRTAAHANFRIVAVQDNSMRSHEAEIRSLAERFITDYKDLEEHI